MTAAGRQAGVRAAERSMRARKRASEVAAPSTWEVPALPTTTPRMVNATKTTWYESILQKKKKNLFRHKQKDFKEGDLIIFFFMVN